MHFPRRADDRRKKAHLLDMDDTMKRLRLLSQAITIMRREKETKVRGWVDARREMT